MSGNEINVNLTPNEYYNMKTSQEDFRLCVVTKAKNLDNAKLNIFSFAKENHTWSDQHGNKLEIKELVGARCTSNK